MAQVDQRTYRTDILENPILCFRREDRTLTSHFMKVPLIATNSPQKAIAPSVLSVIG